MIFPVYRFFQGCASCLVLIKSYKQRQYLKWWAMRAVFCVIFSMIMAAALAQEAAAPRITVTSAAKRELAATLTVTGTLVPRDEVRVMAQIDGLSVTKIIAEEGDRVEQGQALLTLDDIMLQTQLAQSN